jgi:hypothetical protein
MRPEVQVLAGPPRFLQVTALLAGSRQRSLPAWAAPGPRPPHRRPRWPSQRSATRAHTSTTITQRGHRLPVQPLCQASTPAPLPTTRLPETCEQPCATCRNLARTCAPIVSPASQPTGDLALDQRSLVGRAASGAATSPNPSRRRPGLQPTRLPAMRGHLPSAPGPTRVDDRARSRTPGGRHVEPGSPQRGAARRTDALHEPRGGDRADARTRSGQADAKVSNESVAPRRLGRPGILAGTDS